ncbi:MAG: hypothetical protein C0399_03475 [Syntrophus sp. (in: bacteria)]|nr:hypothetical protein [Syntrophus sp. (in: bacteria)]
MLMSFGKYKGKPVETLPENYIRWLMSNIDLREPLLSEIRGILHEGTGMAPTTDKIKGIYRQLAMQYHPDRISGNGDVMKGINIFYEQLQGICS